MLSSLARPNSVNPARSRNCLRSDFPSSSSCGPKLSSSCSGAFILSLLSLLLLYPPLQRTLKCCSVICVQLCTKPLKTSRQFFRHMSPHLFIIRISLFAPFTTFICHRLLTFPVFQRYSPTPTGKLAPSRLCQVRANANNRVKFAFKYSPYLLHISSSYFLIQKG